MAQRGQHPVRRPANRLAGHDPTDPDPRARRALDGLPHPGDGQDRTDADQRVGRPDHQQLRLRDRLERGWARTCPLHTLEAEARHLVPLPALDEVGLEGQVATRGLHHGPHRVIGSRQQPAGHAQRLRQRGGGIGQAGALAHEGRAMHVRGQVGVADAEPGLGAVALQHPHAGLGVARHAPALDRICQAGQGVEDGVQVRADRQALPLEVVGHVDHHRQFAGRQHLLQPVGELGSAGSAGQEHGPHPRTIPSRRGGPVLRPRRQRQTSVVQHVHSCSAVQHVHACSALRLCGTCNRAPRAARKEPDASDGGLAGPGERAMVIWNGPRAADYAASSIGLTSRMRRSIDSSSNGGGQPTLKCRKPIPR